MGRISGHRGLVGTGRILFEQRRYSQSIQTTPPVMNLLTPKTASMLSLTDNLEELGWYFQDMFDQFGNVYCLFNDINRLLVDCLRISFVRNPTTCFLLTSPLKMPVTQTYNRQSFTPFPIEYSSESFAPLVRKNRQISHVRYLLRGQPAALAHFRHYLTDCSTIFALEQCFRNCETTETTFSPILSPPMSFKDFNHF